MIFSSRVTKITIILVDLIYFHLSCYLMGIKLYYYGYKITYELVHYVGGDLK